MLKDAKPLYYTAKFENSAGNSKETINKETINIDNSSVTDSQTISDNINNYFSNIGQELTNKIPICNTSSMSYLSNIYNDYTPLDTSPEEIISIIKSIKDSAPGHDGIHIKVIKLASTILVPIISK